MSATQWSTFGPCEGLFLVHAEGHFGTIMWAVFGPCSGPLLVTSTEIINKNRKNSGSDKLRHAAKNQLIVGIV